MSSYGYVEGRNVRIECRWVEGQYDRLPELAADLVGQHVAVIAVAFLPAALATKAATATIPIVFLTGCDPVAAGLVSSLNRPNSNVTGLTMMDAMLGAKNLELLHELVPKATVIAVLMNRNNVNAEPQLRDLQTAFRTRGVQLVILTASHESEIDVAFATLAQQQIGAMLVGYIPSACPCAMAFVRRNAHDASDGDRSRRRWADNCVVHRKTLVTEAVWRPSGSLGKVMPARRAKASCTLPKCPNSVRAISPRTGWLVLCTSPR